MEGLLAASVGGHQGLSGQQIYSGNWPLCHISRFLRWDLTKLANPRLRLSGENGKGLVEAEKLMFLPEHSQSGDTSNERVMSHNSMQVLVAELPAATLCNLMSQAFTVSSMAAKPNELDLATSLHREDQRAHQGSVNA